jgi:hypothetical protein
MLDAGGGSQKAIGMSALGQKQVKAPKIDVRFTPESGHCDTPALDIAPKKNPVTWSELRCLRGHARGLNIRNIAVRIIPALAQT